MKFIRTIFFSLIIFTAIYAQAGVEVLFHPYDKTLDKAAEAIRNAHHSVDMALYNIDATKGSPVFRELVSNETQKKIKDGKLQVRLIFEGYAELQADDDKKMAAFEKLGVDVKHLKSSKKMHHKFAVIDYGHKDESLITGSANWSTGSMNNYSEAIMFFEDSPKLTQAYASEYQLMWRTAVEFGKSHLYEKEAIIARPKFYPGKLAHFNSDNFSIKGSKISAKSTKTNKGWTLTRQIVKAIDGADDSIKIATTRFKIRPIYNALLRAAKRGVKIDIVVSMGEYSAKKWRDQKTLKSCKEEYDRKCSSGQNFATFIVRDDFTKHENVNLRVKFFHLDLKEYLSHQMHSKYIIIDDELVLSGSFNWSVSSEYNHIENLVELDANQNNQQGALDSYNMDFDRLWSLNRTKLKSLQSRIKRARSSKRKMYCGFKPMTLSHTEIDQLLSLSGGTTVCRKKR